MAWRGSVWWVLPLIVLFGSVLGLYLIAGERLGGSDDAAPVAPVYAPAAAVSAGPSALLVQVD